VLASSWSTDLPVLFGPSRSHGPSPDSSPAPLLSSWGSMCKVPSPRTVDAYDTALFVDAVDPSFVLPGSKSTCKFPQQLAPFA